MWTIDTTKQDESTISPTGLAFWPWVSIERWWGLSLSHFLVLSFTRLRVPSWEGLEHEPRVSLGRLFGSVLTQEDSRNSLKFGRRYGWSNAHPQCTMHRLLWTPSSLHRLICPWSSSVRKPKASSLLLGHFRGQDVHLLSLNDCYPFAV